MILSKKDTVISFLIASIPVFLVFSIFIAEVILLIISILFFFDLYKAKTIKKRFTDYFLLNIFLLSYFLYVSLNSIFLEGDLLIRSTIFYFRFYIYIFAILFYLQTLKIHELLLKSFFITSILLIIDGTFQFMFKFNLLGMPLLFGNRISSFFGSELVMGSYMVRLMPLFLIFALRYNVKKIIILILLFSSMILFSGERTALFLLFLSFSIIFFAIKKYRKMMIYASTLFIIFFVSLINFNSSYYERFTQVFYGLNLMVPEKERDDYKLPVSFFDKNNNIRMKAFSAHHQNHYAAAFKIFKNNYIFGGGSKSFRFLCKKDEYQLEGPSCSTHPHNIIMQFLSELGLIGFFFLFMFHSLLTRDFIKILKLKNNENGKIILIFSIIGIIINVFPLIPSGNFFNNWLSIIFAINLANYFYLREKYIHD